MNELRSLREKDYPAGSNENMTFLIRRKHEGGSHRSSNENRGQRDAIAGNDHERRNADSLLKPEMARNGSFSRTSRRNELWSTYLHISSMTFQTSNLRTVRSYKCVVLSL